jgi:DNA uptake protein ComE-like DNA-binding protein
VSVLMCSICDLGDPGDSIVDERSKDVDSRQAVVGWFRYICVPAESTSTSRVPPPANTLSPDAAHRQRRSFDAWIRRNWWCVLCPLISFGWLTWVGFVYAGARARVNSWFGYAIAYGVLSGVAIGLLTAAGNDTRGAMHSAAIAMSLGMMLGGTVHGLGIRGRYEARIAQISDTTLEAAERRLSAQRLARRLVLDQPERARQLGVGRPDLLGSFNAGLVDLNSAPAFVIESVSGVDAQTAARIIRTREQLKGQFSSLDDMDLVLDLPEDIVAKLRDVAIFVPR